MFIVPSLFFLFLALGLNRDDNRIVVAELQRHSWLVILNVRGAFELNVAIEEHGEKRLRHFVFELSQVRIANHRSRTL